MNALASMFDTARSRWAAGAALAALLVATRSEHFAPLHALPSASVAVFFAGGIVLRSWRAFAALFALAFATDLFAITMMDVSSFCFTPAYVFLVPAYGALWLAGRWYARRHLDAPRTLLLFAAAALAGSVACELLSSGGFYVFSGLFVDLSLAEFGASLVRYYPAGLEAMAFWLVLAVGVYAALVAVRARTTSRT